jgi:hypothetical protein
MASQVLVKQRSAVKAKTEVKSPEQSDKKRGYYEVTISLRKLAKEELPDIYTKFFYHRKIPTSGINDFVVSIFLQNSKWKKFRAQFLTYLLYNDLLVMVMEVLLQNPAANGLPSLLKEISFEQPIESSSQLLNKFMPVFSKFPFNSSLVAYWYKDFPSVRSYIENSKWGFVTSKSHKTPESSSNAFKWLLILRNIIMLGSWSQM